MDNRELLLELKHCTEECIIAHPADRMMAFNASFQQLNELISQNLDTLYALFSREDYSSAGMTFASFTEALSLMTGAIAKEDYTALTDVMEGTLLPLLEEGLSMETRKISVGDIDFLEANLRVLQERDASFPVQRIRDSVISDGDASAGYAACGDICYAMSAGEDSFCLCGNMHPYRDALIRASHWREEPCLHHVLPGSALIYEAAALLHSTAGVPVTILEENPALLKLILKTQNLEYLLQNPRLAIVFAPLRDVLPAYLKPDYRLHCTLESVRAIRDNDLREKLARFRINTLTETNQAMYYNFTKNQSSVTHNASELRPAIKGKTVYLVARGPSLDPAIPLLEKRMADSVILCVESASGKLLSKGIHPDYIVLTENNPAITRHMDHPFDYEKTALILLATAAENAVSAFQGKKYIVYQKDYTLSEKSAQEEEQILFSTGGSVATLCLDIAIRLEAAQIICLGLDFAYTDNRSHATGTTDSMQFKEENQAVLKVKSVSGTEWDTSRNLNMYRAWVEKRLKEPPYPPRCINVSDGAFIEGMHNLSTAEALFMVGQITL